MLVVWKKYDAWEFDGINTKCPFSYLRPVILDGKIHHYECLTRKGYKAVAKGDYLVKRDELDILVVSKNELNNEYTIEEG